MPKLREKFDDNLPLANGVNGRDASGRFAKGNRAAVGRSIPNSKRRAEIQRQLFDAATPEILAKIINQLLYRARAGESWAVREVFDRLIGKPTTSENIEVEEAEVRVDIMRRRVAEYFELQESNHAEDMASRAALDIYLDAHPEFGDADISEIERAIIRDATLGDSLALDIVEPRTD